MTTLTQEQEDIKKKCSNFIVSADKDNKIFIIEGFSGTGKSTLVKSIIEELPKLFKTLKLIAPTIELPTIYYTATTHSATDNLSKIINKSCTTIHSLIGIIPKFDVVKRKSFEVLSHKCKHDFTNSIIFIDEISHLSSRALKLLFERLNYYSNVKLVFIGDPYQLISFDAKTSPAFNMGISTHKLTEVVRQQKDSLIKEVSVLCKTAVETGTFFSFTPDDKEILVRSREDFDFLLLQEFSRPDWEHRDSKYLAYTNKAVIYYNNLINKHLFNTPHLKEGDFAVVNSYITNNNFTFKTDQIVTITKIENAIEQGLQGKQYTLDGYAQVFMPNSLAEKKALMNQLHKDKEYSAYLAIENFWVDLRPAFACTVHKSQGMTLKKVFLDLDDIKKCRNPNHLARLLYVGISRASTQVILTGDLI